MYVWSFGTSTAPHLAAVHLPASIDRNPGRVDHGPSGRSKMARSRILSVHRRGTEPEFHLFIDESRTQDQFCLTGCVVSREDHHDLIHSRFEAIKTRFFPTLHTIMNPIVFHRREIANGKPPFEFHSDKEREDFWNRLYVVLNEARFKVIFATATYDKSLEPGERAADAYRRGLRFLLLRYAGYLHHLHARGDVYA